MNKKPRQTKYRKISKVSQKKVTANSKLNIKPTKVKPKTNKY